jgi:pilus assembly protein Flp/PilA
MERMTRLRRVLSAHDQGASAVEYALLLAGIVAVCIFVVFATFRAAGALYDDDCTTVGTNDIAGAPAAC